MAIIIPIEVTTNEELVRATTLESTVIFIKNKEMYENVVKKEKKRSVSKALGKLGGVSAVLSIPVGLFFPAALLPMLIGGVGVGIHQGCTGGQGPLTKYTVAVDEVKKMLVLTKTKGDNAFRKTDKIENYSYGVGKNTSYKQAVRVNTMEELDYHHKKNAPCIIVETDLYKLLLSEQKDGLRSKVGFLDFAIVTIINDKINKNYIMLNKSTFNRNYQRIEGLDINRLILDNDVEDLRIHKNTVGYDLKYLNK